jgi:hypothetical protein
MKIKQMYKLRTVFFVVLLIVSVNESCKHIFKKDLSLTSQQYMGQGLPSYNRTWSADDFQKAQAAFNRLIIKNFHSLPRKDSRKSGDVFSRIVSEDNLRFLSDTTISLRNKAFRIQSLGNFMGQIGSIYTDKLNTKQYYSEELTEIYATHLSVRSKMLELAEEIDKSTKPEDIMMKAGRNGIVSSYVLLITFIVSEQEKTNAFTAGDLRRLNTELSNSITGNIRYLDSLSKQKISAALKRSIEESPNEFTEKTYNDILKLIDEKDHIDDL